MIKKILAIGLISLGVGVSTLSAEISVGKCFGCHGKAWDKKALGKSKIVSEMTQKEIEEAMLGYKDGSYGGAMKGLMKGQLSRFDEAQIKEMAMLIKPEKVEKMTSSKCGGHKKAPKAAMKCGVGKCGS